jgi:tyrosyl-tRNA synthetase
VLLNKEKVSDMNLTVNSSHLLNDTFLLIQKGKKNYYLLKAE